MGQDRWKHVGFWFVTIYNIYKEMFQYRMWFIVKLEFFNVIETPVTNQ